MTYLVKYTDESTNRPLPADITEVSRWEVIDQICEGSSLIDINQYLMRKELPIVSSMVIFRLIGSTIVYSVNVTEQLYILDSNHDACMQIMREYKLKKILHNG